MAEFSKKYKDIISDIDSNIKDEKEREFVNKKIAEISMLHMEVINEIAGLLKNKIDIIEENQKKIQTEVSKINSKVSKIESSVTGMENDLYDDGFEFEIICPYCNSEFVADVESKSSIKCPECNNTIELDWNGGESEEKSCHGHCSSCGSRCGGDFLDEFGEDINFIDEEDDDDDM